MGYRRRNYPLTEEPAAVAERLGVELIGNPLLLRLIASALSTATIKHLHLAGDDFGGVAILAILALPFTST